jgi:transcriptional regulator with XRE-family HTH domain
MAKGLSQGKLERLTLSAHPYISNCEKQDQQPSVNKFAMLCIALDCEPKDLVAFDFEPIETLIKQYKQDHKPLE